MKKIVEDKVTDDEYVKDETIEYYSNLTEPITEKEENKQKNIIYNKEKKEKLTDKELLDFRNSENEYRKKLRIKTVSFYN